MVLGFLGLPSASSIAKAIFNTAFSAALTLIADAVKSLLDALFSFMSQTTEPVFTSGWWTGAGHTLWLEVLSVSGGIMVIALMLAALEGMWSGTTAPMTKAIAAVPMAVVKTVGVVSVVSVLVSGSDQVANYFDGSIVSKLGAIPALMAVAIGETGIVGMIFAAIIIIAVLGLWAELAVRAALLYLVVMTAPMVIGASIHPKLRDSWRKLAEIGAGIIFSKVLVALALAVAFSELDGLAQSPSLGQAVGALVAGITTLLLSCFAPFVLFRLFSLEVAHLEGLARRPTRAARDAQQIAYYNRSGIGSFLNRHGTAGGGAGGAGAAGGAGGVVPKAGGPGGAAAPAAAAASGVGAVAAAGAKAASGAAKAAGAAAKGASAGTAARPSGPAGAEGLVIPSQTDLDRHDSEIREQSLARSRAKGSGQGKGVGLTASVGEPTRGAEGAGGGSAPERETSHVGGPAGSARPGAHGSTAADTRTGRGSAAAPPPAGRGASSDVGAPAGDGGGEAVHPARPPAGASAAPVAAGAGGGGPQSARDAVRGAPAGPAHGTPGRLFDAAPGENATPAAGGRPPAGRSGVRSDAGVPPVSPRGISEVRGDE